MINAWTCYGIVFILHLWFQARIWKWVSGLQSREQSGGWEPAHWTMRKSSAPPWKRKQYEVPEAKNRDEKAGFSCHLSPLPQAFPSHSLSFLSPYPAMAQKVHRMIMERTLSFIYCSTSQIRVDNFSRKIKKRKRIPGLVTLLAVLGESWGEQSPVGSLGTCWGLWCAYKCYWSPDGVHTGFLKLLAHKILFHGLPINMSERSMENAGLLH